MSNQGPVLSSLQLAGLDYLSFHSISPDVGKSMVEKTRATKSRRTKRVATRLACFLFAAASFGECTTPLPVKKEFKDSEAVIIGTVMSSRLAPQSWYTFDGTEFVVQIDQTVKGKQSGEITIFSEHSDAGYNLEVGKEYLLFLSTNYQRWVVNKCGNSGTVDQEDKVIKELEHLFDNY
jgi:hypothetical protein